MKEADLRGLRDVLITALGPLLWGTTYLTATELLPGNRPLLLGAMRALPVGLLILLLFRRLPWGVWWGRMLVLGALNIAAVFVLLFEAAYRLPGGVAATLGATQPLLVALLAWTVLGEKPQAVTVGAALTGLAGVALLVLGPQAGLDPLGAVCALGMATSMACATILTKRWGFPVPVLLYTGWQLVSGGLLLLPLVFLFEGLPAEFTTTNVLGFVYLGLFNTGLAYGLWFRGLERMTAAATTFLMLLVPLVAATLGFIVLGQTLSPLQLAGGLLVIASIAVAQAVGLRRAK